MRVLLSTVCLLAWVALPGASAAPASSPPSSKAPVLVAAGDIAGEWEEDEATAKLLDALSPDVVLTLGDNAYPQGSTEEFSRFYAPTWGRHRSKTRPAPGNHDHGTAQLEGYCRYFGDAAHCQNGTGGYAFDVGAWRVFSLDSGGGRPLSAQDTLGNDSPQLRWLAAELAKNPKKCTLAYWHHPRFSSGPHGDDARSAAVWALLYRAGVDVVLTGHDHHYERFAPLAPDGSRDDTRGIVQFIVGTGGAPLRRLATRHPHSLTHNAEVHGVLKLTLEPGAYRWAFVPVAGKSFVDQGQRACQ